MPSYRKAYLGPAEHGRFRQARDVGEQVLDLAICLIMAVVVVTLLMLVYRYEPTASRQSPAPVQRLSAMPTTH